MITALPHHGPVISSTVAAVDLAHVSKVYGEGELAVAALRDVTLAVSQGEFLILAGPSGSGKSTLLSIVGCVLTTSGGNATLFGEPLAGLTEAELPPLRLRFIGYVFQDAHLIPALTAKANVELPLLLRGWSPQDAAREAAEALASVHLEGKQHRKPAALSGGERQRVAVARAIAGRPPLILADEPTSSLDAVAGHALIELLRDLAKARGQTVLVVTHDNRIFPLADRVVHLEDGRIVDA
jgi:putative ABC transport system ATP-binding protein